VVAKIKQGSLIVCLFLFLFVVIGGGLHLNPGGALLAAATGTPLVIHAFNRGWRASAAEHEPHHLSSSTDRIHCGAEVNAGVPADLVPGTAPGE
jgi:hypothetical protein